MIDHGNRKKKLIISFKNLSEELRELFKEAYPDGYKDYIQKTIKPNGEPIFVVPLETDDTSYMIKFDVTIDTGMVDDDLDKDLYGSDDEQSETEFAPLSEAIDKEEGNNHSVGKMRHGAIEEFDGLPEDKKEFELANADLDDEYGDDRPDDGDSYSDEEDNEEEDREPDDEDLLDIEALLAEADAGEGILREDNPPDKATEGKKKRGRKPKSLNPDIASVQAVGDAVKEARKTTAKAKKEALPASDTKKTKATKKASVAKQVSVKATKVTVKKTADTKKTAGTKKTTDVKKTTKTTSKKAISVKKK